MNNKDFNQAFRRSLRPPEPEPEQDLAPPPEQPRRAQSIDAGAGTSGSRMQTPPSMNDLIRRAADERG